MCGNTAVHLPHFTSPERHLKPSRHSLCTPSPFPDGSCPWTHTARGPFETAAPTERCVSDTAPPPPWQYQGSIPFRGSVPVPSLEPFAFLFAVGCLSLPSFGRYEEGPRERGGASFMGAVEALDAWEGAWRGRGTLCPHCHLLGLLSCQDRVHGWPLTDPAGALACLSQQTTRRRLR